MKIGLYRLGPSGVIPEHLILKIGKHWFHFLLPHFSHNKVAFSKCEPREESGFHKVSLRRNG